MMARSDGAIVGSEFFFAGLVGEQTLTPRTQDESVADCGPLDGAGVFFVGLIDEQTLTQHGTHT
jgi:hypothetical protein